MLKKMRFLFKTKFTNELADFGFKICKDYDFNDWAYNCLSLFNEF
jgi:hypothetical protein